jgi:hypothetical protein
LPRPAGPQGIIGREPELRRVDELLDAIEAGPTALVIEGEIGIGKTALWKHGLAAAVNRSHRVLACRPIDAEAQLAYAALGDLLAEAPEGALAELPGPQRHALEVALLRAEPEEQRSLPRAVALGLLGVLRALARTRLILLIERLRRRRAARPRYQAWPLSEPVVPALRGWPVERPGR